MIFFKSTKKFISITLCFALLSCTLFVTASAADTDYEITNPYALVDWSTVNQYKADLHSHTNASDGRNTLVEMTEAHYENGFDIVAVTDHGIVDYGWTEQRVIPALSVLITTFRKGSGGIVAPLSSAGGTAANGSSYSYVTNNGSDYYYQTGTAGDGKMMMRVPYGNENNPTSLNNAHVNSWFVDYGHGILGGTSDYITPISGVDKLGGLSVINHPGEYSNARDELFTADAYDCSKTNYKYIVNKFAGLLTDYNSCLGIDVNSKGDERTRFDRKLWDILLQRVVPTGRNVFGIATSDAHSTSSVYSGYTMMCMDSLTVDELRSCMTNGEFFAASKYLGNYDEIAEIAGYLVESDNADAADFGNQFTDVAQAIAAELNEGEQRTIYHAPNNIEAPQVTNIAVNESADSITLTTTDNAMLVRWIADGKTIATGNTIDLDEYSDKIGSYVRAEIFGEGGIVYSQPFTLDYDGAPAAQDNSYIDIWRLASIVPDTIVRLIATLPLFDWIWNLMNK